ncbi:leucine-rich repeat domain-containing protein [Pseudoteredinibacter isoporae]|uniref:leucine-rich repeat domain-containing protein n=1 Tax=Pseudoteredinibacter isoporae TaxID=570281 RepID=UPI00310A8D10
MYKTYSLLISLCLLMQQNLLAASDPVSGLEFTDLGGTLRIDGCTGVCPANLTIPDTLASDPGKPVVEIADDAFNAFGASSGILNTINLPSSLVTIGNQAFRDNNLTSVNLPSGVTTIGDNAFRGNNLNSVNLPNGLLNIGLDGFRENNLTSINLPNTLTSIGTRAFINNSLTSVNIPSSITTFGVQIFQSNNISSFTLPSNMTHIPEEIFASNPLINLSIPSHITSIGNQAFANTSLNSLTLNEGLEDIGVASFGNNQLTTLTIPASVTTIQNFAFSFNSLTTVHFDGTRPTLTDTDPLASFGNNPGLATITYYIGNSGWPGSDISGITPTGIGFPASTSGAQAVPSMSTTSLMALSVMLLLLGWRSHRTKRSPV